MKAAREYALMETPQFRCRLAPAKTFFAGYQTIRGPRGRTWRKRGVFSDTSIGAL
jgi:hypothetical protein